MKRKIKVLWWAVLKLRAAFLFLRPFHPSLPVWQPDFILTHLPVEERSESGLTASLLRKSIEIQKCYFPTAFPQHFTTCVSEWACLQETEMWELNIWRLHKCCCEHFVQASLSLWLWSPWGLWPVRGTMSSGRLFPSSTFPAALPKLAPSQFTFSTRLSFMLWCAQDLPQGHLRCLCRGNRDLP